MNTKLELHSQKRKAGRDEDDMIDSPVGVAESNTTKKPQITMLEAHEPPAMAMADSEKLARSGDEMETTNNKDDITTESELEGTDSLEANHHALSGVQINRPIKRDLSSLEDSPALDSYDSREHRRRLSNNITPQDLPRPNHDRNLPTSSIQPPNHEAETFMKLYRAITYFLAALGKQRSSPFKTSPPETQDEASGRERSSSKHNSTTDLGNLHEDLEPDRHDMPDIARTTSSNSAAPTVADREGTFIDDEWDSQNTRICAMLVRLIGWKNDFKEGDLGAVLDGTPSTAAADGKTARSLLLGIGGNLNDLVEDQMVKPIMDERLRSTAAKLNDRVQKGNEEIHDDSSSSDDASSIASDGDGGSDSGSGSGSGSGTISSVELIIPTVNQQLDEAARKLRLLINMNIPAFLKRRFYRRGSMLRKRVRKGLGKSSELAWSLEKVFPKPFNGPWKTIPHAYGGKVPTPGVSLGDKDTGLWALAQEKLQEIQQLWRAMRPSLYFGNQLDLDKPWHMKLVISSNPAVFQGDKFQELLAGVGKGQGEHTSTDDQPVNLFSDAQIRSADNGVCADIVETFRDTVPKVHHRVIFQDPEGRSTTIPSVESVESIDFTLTLLESLPHWVLYTNFPDAEQLVYALGASVQRILLDELWDSCASFYCQVHEAFSSLDSNTDLALAMQQYVQALFLDRVERLSSLYVTPILVGLWKDLLFMVRELISELRNYAVGMHDSETETEKQSVALPTSLSSNVILKRQAPASPSPPQPKFKSELGYEPSLTPFCVYGRPTTPPNIVDEQLPWTHQRQASPNSPQQPLERATSPIKCKEKSQSISPSHSRSPIARDQSFNSPTRPSVMKGEDPLERPMSPPIIYQDELSRNPQRGTSSPPSLAPSQNCTPSTLVSAVLPSEHNLFSPGEREDHPGSTSTLHIPNNIAYSIEVASPVLPPPAHLLFYAVPRRGDGRGDSGSPLERGPTKCGDSSDEEATEPSSSMRQMRIGEGFIN